MFRWAMRAAVVARPWRIFLKTWIFLLGKIGKSKKMEAKAREGFLGSSIFLD